MSTRNVIVTTRPIGQSFGYVGIIKARNGRVIHQTATVPFEAAAERLAVAYATDRGWSSTVR